MSTTTKPTEVICVWLDETSDAANPKWIVSLDRLDETGGAVTTKTLDVLDTEEEAIESAQDEATGRGLPVRRS